MEKGRRASKGGGARVLFHVPQLRREKREGGGGDFLVQRGDWTTEGKRRMRSSSALSASRRFGKKKGGGAEGKADPPLYLKGKERESEEKGQGPGRKGKRIRRRSIQ